MRVGVVKHRTVGREGGGTTTAHKVTDCLVAEHLGAVFKPSRHFFFYFHHTLAVGGRKGVRPGCPALGASS